MTENEGMDYLSRAYKLAATFSEKGDNLDAAEIWTKMGLKRTWVRLTIP
jgi:hypothetical protein